MDVGNSPARSLNSKSRTSHFLCLGAKEKNHIKLTQVYSIYSSTETVKYFVAQIFSPKSSINCPSTQRSRFHVNEVMLTKMGGLFEIIFFLQTIYGSTSFHFSLSRMRIEKDLCVWQWTVRTLRLKVVIFNISCRLCFDWWITHRGEINPSQNITHSGDTYSWRSS